MGIKEELEEKLKKAVKEKDSRRSLVLRTLIATLHNQEIEKRGLLKDEELIQLFLKEIKKREEAVELYKKGGRLDLAEKEKEEIGIIKSFLPPTIPEDELDRLVEEAIKKTGAKDKKDIGKVIGVILVEAKGIVDKGQVAHLVIKKLNISQQSKG